MPKHSKHRRGTTMIDVLASFAAVGVCFAIMMPAIQVQRDTARQAGCAENLKMLGLANHNYHDVYKSFPAMRLGTHSGPGEQANQKSNRYSMSGLVSLLPFLEQEKIYDIARRQNFGPVPWRPDPNTWSNQLPYLLCASDTPNNNTAVGSSNYKFSMGTTVPNNHSVWGKPHNGVYTVIGDPRARRRTFRMRDIRDGTSNTIAMTERRIGDRDNDLDFANVATGVEGVNTEEVRDAWAACWATVDKVEKNQYAAGQAIRSGSRPGDRWPDGRPYFAGVNTIMPPNGPSCLIGTAHGGPGVFSASSHHPGLVQVLIADGSTCQITNDIDLEVWWALGTKSVGEGVEREYDRQSPPRVSRLARALGARKDVMRAGPLQDLVEPNEEAEAEELEQLARDEKVPENRTDIIR